MHDETLAAFASLLGAENFSTDAEECRRAGTSWAIEDARRTGETPIRGVARPADASEIAALLKAAAAMRTPVYVVGGGSNVTGRRRDAPAGIALDLSRLTEVSLDEESLLATAGAGVSLASLEEQLNRHGYTLGHFPRSMRLATVGGAAATNAIGLFSGRYGRQSDLTAALQAVLPGGDIITTSPVPGSQAVFDLHGLFIGAEGRLGVIAAVTFKMRPAPEARAWVAFSFSALAEAIDAARLVLRSDSRPAALRIFDSADESGSAPPVLLLGFEGEELTQTGQYQLAYAICQQLGGTPLPAEFGEEWFERREEAGEWAANRRKGGLTDVFAFGANWATLKRTEAAVRSVIAPLVTRLSLEICHVTPQGAALEWHWEAQAEPPTSEASLQLYERIAAAAYTACHAEGGIIAHHYGVGATRQAAFARERGAAEMQALQAIKNALDPRGILNP